MRTQSRRYGSVALWIVLTLLAAHATAWAQDEAATPWTPGPGDPVELEIFLDGVVPSLMQAYHVPGAVVVIVKDGVVVVAKGYGYADLESRRTVEPETTLFRVASVSKLFTTTAVMQLVEQGKLDLAADVTEHIDFELEDGFDKPITLGNLLTHTPGFDDEFLRTSQPLDAPQVPLGRFLADEMPRRVMPPGEMISYSNQGLALAGYMVERVSGQSFETYVQDNVLRPLGMEHTRFGIPGPVPSELATAYEYRAGDHIPLGFDRLLDFPAGDLITTGTDMARFMIAHLRLGRLGDVRILETSTARTMQSRQFTHHAEMNGWCYGFYEGSTNGVRTIEHGGSWRGFGTELFLIPRYDVGVFISTNLEYSPRFFRIARRRLFDRYFPAPPPARPAVSEEFDQRAEALAGNYLPVRRVRNSILKLGNLMGVLRIVPGDDGVIELHFPGDALPPRKLVEIEPNLFRDLDGDGMATVRLDDDGDVTHVLWNGGGMEKMSWRRDPAVHIVILGGALVLFVLTAAGWILGWLSRVLAGGPLGGVMGWPKFVAWLVCVLQSIFLIELFQLLTDINVYDLMQEIPTKIKVLLALPLVATVLTLVMVHRLFKGFRTEADAPLASLHYFFLTVAAVLVVVLEWHWNVLGYWF
jgi:CubicO group peptidase (beta-lactamase class C family)